MLCSGRPSSYSSQKPVLKMSLTTLHLQFRQLGIQLLAEPASVLKRSKKLPFNRHRQKVPVVFPVPSPQCVPFLSRSFFFVLPNRTIRLSIVPMRPPFAGEKSFSCRVLAFWCCFTCFRAIPLAFYLVMTVALDYQRKDF